MAAALVHIVTASVAYTIEAAVVVSPLGTAQVAHTMATSWQIRLPLLSLMTVVMTL